MVGFVKTSIKLATLLPPLPLVMPPVTDGALQLYNVPAGTIPFTPLIGVILKNTPLQVVPVIALITADGFTVMVIANAAPVQLPDNGVTV